MRAISADGFGGLCSLLSFAYLYEKLHPCDTIRLELICLEKVGDAIVQFIPLNWNFKWHGDNINDLELAAKLQTENPSDKVYVLTPDYFGTARPFDIFQTEITWGEILENRFLKYKFPKPIENNVFLGLLTAQENNSYPFTASLISKLCELMPDYKFYFANIKEWSNKNIELDFVKGLNIKYPNFIVYEPKNLASDLIFIGKTMKYFITLDNGIGNYAYCLGRERILLDSRYMNRAFEMRWRHTGFKDSVPINLSPAEIAFKFKLLVKNPELSNMSKVDINSGLFDFIGYKTKKDFNL